MTTKTRDDIHRPSLLDPAEYEFVSAFYQGGSVAMEKSYAREMSEDYYPAVEVGPVFDGNHARKSTCDHCGAVFAHGVLFRHKPTQELIHVGHICATDTIGLPSRAAASRRAAEKAAQVAKANEQAKAKYADWREQNADVIAYLTRMDEAAAAYSEASEAVFAAYDAAYDIAQLAGTTLPRKPYIKQHAPHPFVMDMVFTFNRYGGLSEKQTTAIRKFMDSEEVFAARRAEREAEETANAPTTPLVEGRREVTGVIESTKWQRSDYGETPKILVRESDGNKVWGTVAESAFEETPDTDEGPGTSLTLDAMRGRAVTFKATVTRSNDDEHFGFFKRPTGMKTKEV